MVLRSIDGGGSVGESEVSDVGLGLRVLPSDRWGLSPMCQGSVSRVEICTHLSTDSYPIKMSGKYAFTKSLREVRFLFCQSSEHSAATRSVLIMLRDMRSLD